MTFFFMLDADIICSLFRLPIVSTAVIAKFSVAYMEYKTLNI